MFHIFGAVSFLLKREKDFSSTSPSSPSVLDKWMRLVQVSVEPNCKCTKLWYVRACKVTNMDFSRSFFEQCFEVYLLLKQVFSSED